MDPQSVDVTVLLQSWRAGNKLAFAELIPLLNREPHGIARQQMAGQPDGHTLQTTALLNEAWMRVMDSRRVTWLDRTHFVAACSQIMRRILVDHARGRRAAKRGGGVPLASLEESWVAAAEPDTDVVALDDALEALAGFDARKAKVVELRFFGGLSVKETAAVLDISGDSVERDWRLARSWLARELSKA